MASRFFKQLMVVLNFFTEVLAEKKWLKFASNHSNVCSLFERLKNLNNKTLVMGNNFIHHKIMCRSPLKTSVSSCIVLIVETRRVAPPSLFAVSACYSSFAASCYHEFTVYGV